MHQGCLLSHLAAIHNSKLGTNLQFFKYVVKTQFFALKSTFNYSRANLFSAEPQHLLTIKFDSGGIRGHIGDGPNFFRSRKYIAIRGGQSTGLYGMVGAARLIERR